MNIMTATNGNRARRLEPDARREEILSCAVRLFGERPYSAVSTTELAEAAGVTRGLIHHYFGTKRGLYLEVVRRMLFVPRLDDQAPTEGSLRKRVELAVDWFLDAVAHRGKTFVAIAGAEGVGDDPEVARMLAEADDLAARKMLVLLGVPAETDRPTERAMIRAYGGLVKASMREWIRNDDLTRDEVRLLMVQTLLAIVKDVFPKVTSG